MSEDWDEDNGPTLRFCGILAALLLLSVFAGIAAVITGLGVWSLMVTLGVFTGSCSAWILFELWLDDRRQKKRS